MKKIAIIGAGSWGTSIGIVIAETHPDIDVIFWSYEKSVATSINKNHENNEYLPGRILPGNIRATTNIKFAVENAHGIIFATPSKVTYDIGNKVSRYISPGLFIGHLTKGFCKINNEIYTISQTLEKAIPGFDKKIIAIYGPSHAEEVCKKFHTCLNVAGPDEASRKFFVDLLTCEYMQCREVEDILGVEVGGTLKNPAAIAAGMISILPDCGDNLAGALISEALKEMIELSVYFNAKVETILDISGLGDLVATALSEHSRNRRFGKEISTQILDSSNNLNVFDKILLKIKPEYVIEKMSKQMNYLAEGAYAIEPLVELADQKNISIPVYRSLYEVLLNKKDPILLIETIKNPLKFKELYSNTKIQISDRKKGLENINGYIFKEKIIQKTEDQLMKSISSLENGQNKCEIYVNNAKRFEKLAADPDMKFSDKEIRLIAEFSSVNFSESVEKLSNLYSDYIVDKFNRTISWIYIKIIIFKTKFLYNKKIKISGNIEQIKKAKESANIIYIPQSNSKYNFELLLYALNKKNLPIPRFYVEKDAIDNSLKYLLVKSSGGFFIDRKKFNNYVYKEVLCQYMSTMIEYGVPLMYFPEKIHNEDAFGIKNSFAKIISETMVNQSVEIALVPIGIDFGSLNTVKETKINFGDVVFLSDFTKNPGLLNEISGVFESICED